MIVTPSIDGSVCHNDITFDNSMNVICFFFSFPGIFPKQRLESSTSAVIFLYLFLQPLAAIYLAFPYSQNEEKRAADRYSNGSRTLPGISVQL